MRSAGVITTSRAIVDRFLAGILSAPADYKTYTSSPEAAPPYLVTAVDPEAYPGIDFHEDADGSFCLVDGEIYGLEDGRRDASPSAAETILTVYRRDGRAALAGLDAAALIALYDAPLARFVVARDPMGLSPVYVHFAEASLTWSSGLTDLRRLTPNSSINRVAFDAYVGSGFVPSPWTLTTDHRRLGAGECAVWKDGRTRVERYYQPSGEPRKTDLRERYETLASALPRSLHRRVGDISRTGMLLSAGVDSTLLLGLLRRDYGRAPPCFTFRYEGYEGSLNEGPRARVNARLLGSDHEEISVSPDEVADRIGVLVDAFGDPFSYGLHSVQLSAIGEGGITDLLSGAGADALYLTRQGTNALRFARLHPVARAGVAGLGRIAMPVERAWSALSRGGSIPGVGRVVRAVHGGVWSARTGLTGNTSDWALRYPLRKTIYVDRGIADRGRAARRRLMGEEAARLASEALDVQLRLIELRFFDADHMHSWNHHAGRLHGLAVRTPFTARDLVDGWIKYPSTERDKPDIRKLAATVVPRALAQAPKGYQAVPIDHWLRAGLRPWLEDTLSSRNLRSAGVFDPKGVGSLLRAHMAGRTTAGWALWNIALATLWEEQIRERSRTSASLRR